MKARRYLRQATGLLLPVLVALTPTAGAEQADEEAQQPELTLELVQYDQMGSTFAIESATYLLDGKELLNLKGPELKTRLSSSARLLRAPLPAGLHVVAVRVTYVGRSAVFKYVDRYRFTMKGYLLVESRAGYGVKVISASEERDPLTTEWQQRPMFKLGGLPQRAIVKVRVSPIERGEKKSESDDDLEPLAITISEADAKLLERRARETPPDEPPRTAEAPAKSTAANDEAPVKLTAPGCDLVAVHFAFARSSLDRKARRALEQLSACLLREPTQRVRVEGHCDQRGSDAVNERLGRARAEATVKYLVRCGVMPDRLEMVSFGRRQPVCTETTEVCYARNRRADLITNAASAVPTAVRP